MSISNLVLRYAVVYVLAAIGVAAVIWALQSLLGGNSNSAGTVVPVMVAAMDAGQGWYRRTGAVPEGGFAWKIAAIFTGVIAALGVLQVLVVQLFMPGIFADLPPAFLAIGLAVVLILGLLINRFFFPWGARNMAKASQRKR